MNEPNPQPAPTPMMNATSTEDVLRPRSAVADTAEESYVRLWNEYAALERELAAKDAEIARLTKERDGWKHSSESWEFAHGERVIQRDAALARVEQLEAELRKSPQSHLRVITQQEAQEMKGEQ